METTQRLIVGISGASGVIYGIRLLECLRELNIQTYVTVTEAAETIMKHENQITLRKIKLLSARYFDVNDLTAPLSSGGFQCLGMAVAPCSMKTLAGMANGYSHNLLLRAADVILKERRRLVVVPRETPLNVIHLENMLKLARAGAIVLPAMPAFYHKPKTIDDLVNHVVGKILEALGIEHHLYKRWRAEELS